MDKPELEKCCDLVIKAGLSTGHADTVTDLLVEVLDQVAKLRERIAEREAERDALKAELDLINRQAEDATEFVLAQINTRLKYEIAALKAENGRLWDDRERLQEVE